MTMNRTSTGWMRKQGSRFRARHVLKAGGTDVAAIAIGAGGAVAAADAGRAAGTEAATTAVVAEADGRSCCWFLVASFL